MHFVFFSSRRRHTRFDCDWSSDVCSSDLRWLGVAAAAFGLAVVAAAVSLRAREPAPLNAKRVLVVPFANRTGDSTLDPLANLAADWITRGLALTGVLEIADPAAMVLGGRTGGANRPRQAGHEAPDARGPPLARGSGPAGWGAPVPPRPPHRGPPRSHTPTRPGRLR